MKKTRKMNGISRRDLFQTGAGLAMGSILGPGQANAAGNSEKSSIYESIGVKPVINAQGTMTYLGGSLMPPEVIAAWNEASKHFVNMHELIEKAGNRIAQLMGVPAALVTTGASGALFLGTIAAVLREHPEASSRLPDTSGLRNEVIIQRSHHSGWDAQLRPVGIKFVNVTTPEDVDKAVNDKTALMFFMNAHQPQGKIDQQQWADLAKKHKVPSLMDMAADVPPRQRIKDYVNHMGYDMVALSGGKAMRGPNNTGLLLGGKEFIKIARQNTSPNEGYIGRMLKVSKEEIMACLAAVNRYVHIDPQEEEREWQARISLIENRLKEIPTLKGSQSKPPIANHVPHLNLSWDPKKVKVTGGQVTEQLRTGTPSIVLGGGGGGGGRRRGGAAAAGTTTGIGISVFMLKDGEDQIIADRLYAILKKAAT